MAQERPEKEKLTLPKSPRQITPSQTVPWTDQKAVIAENKVIKKERSEFIAALKNCLASGVSERDLGTAILARADMLSGVNTMTPTFDDHHLHGIDLYHGDGVSSFHDLTIAGVKFVFLKATQGTHMVDPAYADYYRRAKSVGLVVGAYHFFQPGQDAVAQAEHFLKTAKLTTGDLPYVLDSETDGDAIGEQSYAFDRHIKAQTGRQTIPYSGDSFYQDNLAAHFPAADYALWIARYGHQPATPCRFWQFADNGVVMGSDRPIDSNVFYGTIDDLKKLCF